VGRCIEGGSKQRVFGAFFPSLILRVVVFLSHLVNMSSLAPSLLDLMSGRPSEKAMLKVTNPAFFGHQFKWDGYIYTTCWKTVSKRGGTS
jgi:hypothetical protein